MASYNLNEALKKNAPKKQGGEELALDDISRVKVLSPGRQVFKRFIRNRLAVFGTCTLLVMFIFSFIGPFFYPYGQKEIFYKYDTLNVNYGLAKENSAYTGYVYDETLAVDRNTASMMNTNIKRMAAENLAAVKHMGDDGLVYSVDCLGDNVYTLSQHETAKVASFGGGTVKIGTLDIIAKKIVGGEEPAEGFIAEAIKKCKGAEGTFEHAGATYSYKKAVGKKYDIFGTQHGFVIEGDALAPEFEQAAEAADEAFEFNGVSYAVVADGTGKAVYQLGEAKPAMVYTRFVLDTVTPGTTITNEFRTGALLAAYTTGAFTADGADYTVKQNDGELSVYDAQGNHYAEFSSFVLRRYNGEDTMEYALKNTIREAIEAMREQKKLESAVMCSLPQQNEQGEYAYAEDGSLLYNDTEMRITQKDTGEYVLNCDQIIYMIDLYASPSAAHILGTDGDGFDVLARIMYGGRVSLLVGFVVVFLECLLGIIMGGLAGYYGGWVDNLIMRMVDIFYCLPSMPIMIILGSLMDALRMDTYIRLLVMMAALGIMGWAGVARMVRAQILSLREQEFMVATEATGIRVKDRIFRHLVPNVMPQLIVIATMGVGSTIITESTLSFLGLGVKYPLATWGTIINSVSSAAAMAHYTFIWVPVGLLICLTVIAFNFVGDGLRDAYDPKSKR